MEQGPLTEQNVARPRDWRTSLRVLPPSSHTGPTGRGPGASTLPSPLCPDDRPSHRRSDFDGHMSPVLSDLRTCPVIRTSRTGQRWRLITDVMSLHLHYAATGPVRHPLRAPAGTGHPPPYFFPLITRVRAVRARAVNRQPVPFLRSGSRPVPPFPRASDAPSLWGLRGPPLSLPTDTTTPSGPRRRVSAQAARLRGVRAPSAPGSPPQP